MRVAVGGCDLPWRPDVALYTRKYYRRLSPRAYYHGRSAYNPAVCAERLAAGFQTPFFERGIMVIPALSLQHFRLFSERSISPLEKLVESLAGAYVAGRNQPTLVLELVAALDGRRTNETASHHRRRRVNTRSPCRQTFDVLREPVIRSR